jgi:hypothetical protein
VTYPSLNYVVDTLEQYLADYSDDSYNEGLLVGEEGACTDMHFND